MSDSNRPQLKEVITRYPNSNALQEIYFVNDENELNGRYKRFHENGNISIICNYLNNERIGKCYEFSQNGKKWKECTYNENGVTEGPYLEWWENGNPRINAIACKYGNYVGDYTSLWDNGNPYISCFYNKDGKKDGIYVEKSRDGNVTVKKWYKDGKEVTQSEYEGIKDEKPVQMITYYVNNTPNCLNCVKEIAYEYPSTGIKHGICNKFYTNGMISSSCNYVEGIRDKATLKEYDENGFLV